MREWREANKALANYLEKDLTETTADDNLNPNNIDLETVDSEPLVEACCSNPTIDNDNPMIDDNNNPSDDDNLVNSNSVIHSIHNDSNETLEKHLAAWVVLNRVPREPTRDLLKILRSNNNPELPADPRTLLKTPRDMESVHHLGGGEYLYLGIANSLKRVCKIDPSLLDTNEIILTTNIDGLPLRKSSRIHMWPILCKFKSIVFVVAVWSGISSPECADEFLREFLEERADLVRSGVNIFGMQFNVQMVLFICDSIARAWLKGIKSPSGYYACDRCTIKGIHDRCVLFPNESGCVARTDKKFKKLIYLGTHQNRKTILVDYDVKCVDGFILDAMHLVYLGVVKKMLEYWVGNGTTTPRKCRLSVDEKAELSSRLENLGGKMPREFSRQPRKLKELPRYKATEFRQFVLYTGMVVLKGLIKDDMYYHFIHLSVAIRILSDEILCLNEDNLDLAKDLLNWFVDNASQLYTVWFMVYNVHVLSHIVDDVKAYGCLSDITAFDFENHLQVMKKFVRNANSPCTQVGKRIMELESLGVVYNKKSLKTAIKTIYRDSWFLLRSREICQVLSVTANEIIVKTVSIQQYKNFFRKPMRSMDLFIYVLPKDGLITTNRSIIRGDIFRKLVCLPLNGRSQMVLIAVNHACHWD